MGLECLIKNKDVKPGCLASQFTVQGWLGQNNEGIINHGELIKNFPCSLGSLRVGMINMSSTNRIRIPAEGSSMGGDISSYF